MIAWQPSPYTIPLCIAAAISAALAYSTWHRRSAPGAVPLTLLLLAVTLWTTSYAIELGIAGVRSVIFWQKVQYIAIALVPATWFAFAVQYTGRQQWLIGRSQLLLTVHPVLLILLTFTNEQHHLIWSRYDIERVNGMLLLDTVPAAGFWVHTIYSYQLLMLGTLLLVQQFLRSPRLYRAQSGMLLLGALVPWVGNMIYLAGLSPFRGLDLTPFAFTVTGIIICWGLFRYRLLEIIPVARAAVLDSMSDGVVIVNTANRILDMNGAAETIIGQPVSEMIGQELPSQLVSRSRLLRLDRGPIEGEEELLLDVHERQRYFDLKSTALHDPDGQLTGRLLVLRDISERKWSEAAEKKASEELARRARELEQRNHEITVLNEMSDQLQACRSIEESYGIIIRAIRRLFPTSSGSLCLYDENDEQLNVVINWPDTTPRPDGPGGSPGQEAGNGPSWPATPATTDLCVPLTAQDEPVGLLQLRLPAKEEQECIEESTLHLSTMVAKQCAVALRNLKLRDALHQQANRDPLTNLFNRRYMEESLEREVRRANHRKHSLGVVMVDIDRFKAFNDTFGHPAGDLLLKEVGDFLQRNSRQQDIICRYGGEEFMLILPGVSLEGARQWAERIRETVKGISVDYQEQQLGPITLSIGLALFPEHGTTAEALLRAADVALYRAKDEGRDCLRIAFANDGGTGPS